MSQFKNITLPLLVALLMLGIFSLIYFTDKYNWESRNDLEIFILNIGQGDAILIKTPDEKVALIDAGKHRTVLRELGEVLPWFVRNLDLVVGTHPDADHIEGLIPVSERFEIDSFLMNKSAKQSEIYSTLKNNLLSREIPTYEVREANDFQLGCCVVLDTLWPQTSTEVYASEEVNDTSITFILKYDDFEIYLGGDLSWQQEELTIANNKYPKVEVLKVNHHGSQTSSSEKFLSQLMPQVAVVSVGENNSYGHPHPKVLERFQTLGIDLFRTDQQGRIHITVSSDHYEVETEKGLEKYEFRL